MKTKAISSFFVLFAIAAGVVAMTPAAFADHSEVTIVPAQGSGAPGCEEVEYGCFIPGVATVDLGGKVIFLNDDSAAHTFSAGTAADGPTGEFDTSMVMAGNSYEWTADTSGVIDYFCMVHPWMTGLLVVGEGTYIPPIPVPQTPITLKTSTSQSTYDIGDLVDLLVKGKGFTGTQKVAVDVTDPRGNTIVSRSINLTPDTTENVSFRLSEDFKTGSYRVTATTNDSGNTVSSTSYFKIKSQFNSFTISSVDATDQQGNASTLEAGEMGFIKVNLKSNKSIATLVTVNLFDSELTSIGIGSVKTTLSSGESEIILSFMIPEDAVIGPADIYVNAFSDWPSSGGIPLTNEVSSMESIQ